MSVVDIEPSPDRERPLSPRGSCAPTGRQRRIQPVGDRVYRDGKFFRLGGEKFYVKGVTYGPFEPDRNGHPLPDREQVEKDFQQMLGLGANCIRIYHLPPKWFLDLAQANGLKIFLDVPWPKNISFDGNRQVIDAARSAVTAAAEQCGAHPAVFAISVVNEFPADLV